MKPELLAPAGNMDHLKAAIANGADAVYAGFQAFNARIGAKNFSVEELIEATDFCHLHGKKIYLTLNTLLNDFELSAAIDLAKIFYERGIDAIIIQDIGLVHALRTLFPDLKLHASTQMTIHNTEGLNFLEELGFERAILARENSLEEIKKMKAGSKLELECFVHGALCVAYSGQCFASSISFKRSGNRGRCAQNCRLFYDLESDGKRLDSGYLISAKDLFTLPFLKKISQAGITSVKIEGRKKSVEFVAIACRLYRKAIDSIDNPSFKISENEMKLLQIAYNREFSSGYFFGKNPEIIKKDYPGKIGITVGKVLEYRNGLAIVKLFENIAKWDKLSHKKGDERIDFFARLQKNGIEVEKAFSGEVVELVAPHELKKGWQIFKVTDKKLTDLAYSSIKTMKKPEISMNAKISAKQFSIKVFDSSSKIEVFSDFMPVPASKIPLGKKTVEEKLSKIGETFFELKKLEVEIDEGLMVPFSKLNDLRRKAIEEFVEKKLERFRKKVDEKLFAEKKFELLKEQKQFRQADSTPKISIQTDSLGKLESFSVNPSSIVMPLNALEKDFSKIQKYCSEKNCELVISTNPILKDKEVEIVLEKIQKTGKHFSNSVFAIEVNNVGLYHLLSKKGFKRIVIGKNLNVFNSIAVNFFAANSCVERVFPSRELNLKQLSLLKKRSSIALELVAFELPEIMIIEADLLQSNSSNSKSFLTDRNKWKYMIESDENRRTHLFNPMLMNMIPELEKLQELTQNIRIDISKIELETAKNVLTSLEEKLCGKKAFLDLPFTRGSYEKAV